METIKINNTEAFHTKDIENVNLNNNTDGAFAELERAIYAALETYSNVHRGSGHNSMVSTHLYEQARDIVMEYLGLKKDNYTVIFCTSRIAETLKLQLKPNSYQCLSSHEIGLTLGVRTLAVKREALPKGTPLFTGGGTTKLVSKEWVIWADAPDKFEAGTPAIINVIAYAKALLMIKQLGKDIFINPPIEKLTASEILYHDELDKYSGFELLNKLKQTLIGKNVIVPTVEGAKPFINLDNSASTPTFTPIWNAFRQTLWQTEKIKQEIINEVKSICANMLGAPQADYDVIFTSNTTEAINLAAESISLESEEGIEPVILNTTLEHSSNDLPWRMIPNHSLIRLLVDNEGFINLNELEKLLIEYNQEGKFGKKRIKLFAVSGASNVLGSCNNLEEISRIVHRYGARLLVDAAQLVAHRKVDIEKCGIDFLAFSAHKVYAPFGCGVLVVKKGMLNFNSAELERIKLSGEENAGGIAALGKSLVLLQRIGMDIIQEEEQVLTKRALHGLSKIPNLKIHGIKEPESPQFKYKVGVIVFELKNKMPSKIAKKLALQSGIGVRYGCHCAHIIIKQLLKISPFLENFQRLIQHLFPKFRFLGLVRVSIGIQNSEKDVDTLIEALNKITKNSHSSEFSSAQKLMDDFVKETALRVYSTI